jgi:hypothetical protein
MLFGIGMWVVGLALLSPALVLGLASARTPSFYASNQTGQRRKFVYLTGLIGASVSTVVHVSYYGWRLCKLYQITLPYMVELTIDRSIFVCRFLAAFAIAGLLIGRGPCRVPAILVTLWVLFLLWAHGGIIHWA